jgi:hypothetical protein
MSEWKKKEEVDEFGPKRVFTLNHSEIQKGITQCENHVWRKEGENELVCTKCPTKIICELTDKRLE